MDTYKVKLHRVLKDGMDGRNKTEIWADITEPKTCMQSKKLIWWEDEHGHFHDETPNLPAELRDIIDNVWIEKKRYW